MTRRKSLPRTIGAPRAEQRHRPSPLVTVAKVKSAYRLAAVDTQAKALGLSPGMMLADARAIAPDLQVRPANMEADAAWLRQMADWCRRFTPLVALDPPDGLLLDISGAAHLFGGEAKLIAEMESRLAKQSFRARAAIAPTPEAAWALTHFGTQPVLQVPDETTIDETILRRQFGAFPLAALRLEPATLRDLNQVGLRRIDDILLRPRAAIAARFGSHIFARLDGLLGRSKNPISPCFEAPAYLAERRFAEPIVTRDAVEATLLSLGSDLETILTRHGEGARRLAASLFRVDGFVQHIHVGTSRPLRNPQTIARLFHEKFDAAGRESDDDPLDAGYGYDVVRLSALAVEPLDEHQSSWLDVSGGAQDLSDLIDRLGARFGLRRVTRIAFNDTHWPEFAVTALPAADMRKLASIQPQLFAACRNDPITPGLLPARPIRLLHDPEPIETVASVPDGPPVRFRWRRILHDIAAIEGPERIAPEWWKDMPVLTRDYFRAEDMQGRRFWLFREGLYELETPKPRWFMHGLFA